MVSDSKNLRVLLVIEQCNPHLSSVPSEGYQLYREISQLAHVTLVTHQRNKKALEQQKDIDHTRIIYINESRFISKYYKIARVISSKPKGGINWPLLHTLTYPVYAEFNNKVYNHFRQSVLAKKYDIVHGITPMMPRYPFKIIKACLQSKTPFILGPVNGGVPFPPGLSDIAKRENASLNFLRDIGRLVIPGYRETYTKATKILAGSTYTLNLIKNLFNITDERITLLYENGVSEHFFYIPRSRKKAEEKINLLFVGRLVPYKGADMVIRAISHLKPGWRKRIHLTIVGDGEEKNYLQKLARELGLEETVQFTGWLSQPETFQFYKTADIFCFPSVREFGGAVVLEAMASGLPCIVVNNGGIGEYVTEKTGFKIEPISRKYVVQQLAEKIEFLLENEDIRLKMSESAIIRAREFTWPNKAQKILHLYHQAVNCYSPK